MVWFFPFVLPLKLNKITLTTTGKYKRKRLDAEKMPSPSIPPLDPRSRYVGGVPCTARLPAWPSLPQRGRRAQPLARPTSPRSPRWMRRRRVLNGEALSSRCLRVEDLEGACAHPSEPLRIRTGGRPPHRALLPFYLRSRRPDLQAV
jgi:hypothetical protein